MRGKLPAEISWMVSARITPAGAGKTFFNELSLFLLWDHPRRCGENQSTMRPRSVAEGSPPQVRGKRSDNWYRGRCSRITPAGAGKTMCVTIRTKTLQDHPRRCGENCSDTKIDILGVGSPPQVRGKLYEILAAATVYGITPAGAGKTRLARDGFKRRKDHPRRCGEN